MTCGILTFHSLLKPNVIISLPTTRAIALLAQPLHTNYSLPRMDPSKSTQQQPEQVGFESRGLEHGKQTLGVNFTTQAGDAQVPQAVKDAINQHKAAPGPAVPKDFKVAEEGTKEERRAKAQELNK